MSFGLLKHFKEQKSGEHLKHNTQFIENVILGHDLGSILKLMHLKKHHTPETLRLITPRLLNKKWLLESYQFGVSQFRCENAVKEIYKTYFNARFLPQKDLPQFYKDGKFHDFSGRAKPMPLSPGEEFFLTKGYRPDISSLFSEEDWENLDHILQQYSDLRIIEGIEKHQVQDLVNKEEWLVSFKDFKKITCENLFIYLSPKKFLAHLQHKERMTQELIELCSSVEIQGAISITWSLKNEIHSSDGTLFIPQSMTHDWGHFLVEFEEPNLCHALFLIHEAEPQSDDLASKIKLMKRVLDRVFPHFEENIHQEYIRFDDEMFVSQMKGNLLEQVSFDYPTLKLPSATDQKFLTRLILS
jgi:hypothetical protein